MVQPEIETVTAKSVLLRALPIFLPIALVATCVVYLLYATQEAATRRVIAAGQKQLVEVGYTSLANSLAVIGNDAEFIAQDPFLKRWLESRDDRSVEPILAQFQSFARHRGLYEQIRFIGLDGVEAVRVDWNSGAAAAVAPEALRDVSGENDIRQGLKLEPGEIYFSAFDFRPEPGRPAAPQNASIRVAAPVFDAAGHKRGMVILSYLAERALDRVRSLSTRGLGQAWLVDSKGRWLLGPSAADAAGSFAAAQEGRSFAELHAQAWEQIARSTGKGQFDAGGDLHTYAAVELPDGAVTGENILSSTHAAPGVFLLTRTPATAFAAFSRGLIRSHVAALLGTLLLLAALSGFIAHHGARRSRAERLVRALNQRLAKDNAALQSVNRELESFSYSVSHDLRAPLRSIDGFSQALLEDYGDTVDSTGRDYLLRVRGAAQRMGNLIDDLLKLARVSQSELRDDPVDLSLLGRKISAELRQRDPQRNIDFVIAPDLQTRGDGRLLQIALENLLDNAWKFTARQPAGRIEFGKARQGSEEVFFVRDNGAGFDMAHADKLFGVFQRLHAVTEFEGTGIGLATVQRIVYKHGGRVWGEAEKGRGAVFFFALRGGNDEADIAG